MKRTVSIKDVAREAGVSISTVSRVINNSSPVSEKLRKRVEEAIKKLDYKPSAIAVSLRKGHTSTIGFIIPDITNPFFPQIVRGAEDYLRKKGYAIILCNSDRNLKQEIQLLDILMKKNIDGLLFTSTGEYNPEIEKVINKGMKVVFLDRVMEGIHASFVISDNKKGMKELLEFLYKTGHRSFVLINGSKKTFSAKERFEAFKEFMESYKIKDYKYYFKSFSYESGYTIAKKLTDIPDAIVCGNDLIAYGVIDALEERGLRIPEDVSVTGFDDILFSKHYKPPLTTVRQPMYEMGKEAAKLLLQMIKGKQRGIKGLVLETKLVIRNSTKGGK